MLLPISRRSRFFLLLLPPTPPPFLLLLLLLPPFNLYCIGRVTVSRSVSEWDLCHEQFMGLYSYDFAVSVTILKNFVSRAETSRKQQLKAIGKISDR